MIELNTKIPDINFDAIDENGIEKTYKLPEFEGQALVLYFYPKDNTPGCTTEACDFRDNINRLTLKAKVVGVSSDSIQSHLKFKEKHDLNFILASDPERKLLIPFGAYGEKTMCGKTTMGIIRSTFLIDKNGILKNEWRSVKVKGHVDAVLTAIENL